MKRQTYPYADWIHWFAFWFLKNRHPRLKPSPEPTLTIPSWTVLLGQCVITTERQAKTRKTLLITLRHSHTTLSVVYAFHSVLHHGPATRFSKCFQQWPASVGWRFSDIGNWFPDIGKSSTFPDIRKSFPDIGKLIISWYWKLISRCREFQFLISGNNSRYREMLNKNPNGFPYNYTLESCVWGADLICCSILAVSDFAVGDFVRL